MRCDIIALLGNFRDNRRNEFRNRFTLMIMKQSAPQFINRILTMKLIFMALVIGVMTTTVIVPVEVRAGGGEPANLAVGQTLAESRCAHCHAVGRTGASPVAAAPAFRHLGRKWPVENLAEALAEGIVVGHPAMPAFAFSPPEIDDFLGWLQAIQEN